MPRLARRLKERRIGPRMAEVVDFVNDHPDCVKIDAARHVAPTGAAGGKEGLGYGYRTVDRAIRAGLITEYQGRGVRLHLNLTDKGTDLVRSWG